MPARPLALAALAVSLALPSVLQAQPVASATTRGSTQSPTPVLQTPRELQDKQLLERVMEDVRRSGPAGISRHVPALKDALEHMPADYTLVATVGDTLVVRSSDPKTFLPLQLALLTTDEGRKASGIHAIENVYGLIAQTLTFEAVERQDYHAAIAYADRLLAVQCNHPHVLAEKIVALTRLDQCEKALEIAAEALASDDMIMNLNHDLFLRRQGYCQIELGRFDEAKASYEAALKLNPDDQLSINQLTYIAENKPSN